GRCALSRELVFLAIANELDAKGSHLVASGLAPAYEAELRCGIRLISLPACNRCPAPATVHFGSLGQVACKNSVYLPAFGAVQNGKRQVCHLWGVRQLEP